jgi:hypothetical protein
LVNDIQAYKTTRLAAAMGRMPEDRFEEQDLKHKPTGNVYLELQGIMIATLGGRFSEQSVSYLMKKKMIGEPRFPGLTLKTLLNRDLCWNKCTL